jgi:hypothetical protein
LAGATTTNVEDVIDTKIPKIVVDYEEDSDLEDDVASQVRRKDRSGEAINTNLAYG